MEDDKIVVIDEQTGSQTQVGPDGQPVNQPDPSEQLDSGIDMNPSDDLEDVLNDPIEVVKDDDPRLNDPNYSRPQQNQQGQPSSVPNDQMQALMDQIAELRADKEAEKAAAERDKKVNEIKQKSYEVAKEHNALLDQKTRFIMAWHGKKLTAEAARQQSDMDSKITQLAAQHVRYQEQIEEASKPPEETTKTSPAYQSWYNKHSHWLDNPQYNDMRIAAGQIEANWRANKQGNPDSPVFWDAVIEQLQNDGWTVPVGGGYQNQNKPGIIQNRFVGPNAAGGANPAARRQTGGPTTGVGRTSQGSATNTGPRGWTAPELRLAKMFGNDRGQRAKLLDGQYSRTRAGGNK